RIRGKRRIRLTRRKTGRIRRRKRKPHPITGRITPESHALVSVIVPSFNQARFIRETVESVLNQDYPHVELIVVDGGSADETLEILGGFAHLGPNRFRFISEPDRGQAHAFNKGLAMAKGSIIGWLNSDDTYAPG